MPILRQSRPPHSRSTPTLRPAGLPTIRWTGRRSYLNPQRTVTNCLYLGGRVLAGDDSSVATPPRGRGTNHVISGDLGVGDIGVESVDCEHSACHGLVRVPGGLFPIRVIRAKSPIEHYDAAETALAADLAMVTNGSCTVVIQPPRCVADAEIALWFAAIGRSGTGCTPETLRDRRFRGCRPGQNGEAKTQHEDSCAFHRSPPVLLVESGTVSQEYVTSSLAFKVRTAITVDASAALATNPKGASSVVCVRNRPRESNQSRSRWSVPRCATVCTYPADPITTTEVVLQIPGSRRNELAIPSSNQLAVIC